MSAPLNYKIRQQNCWLCHDRTLYWEDQQTLIVSDLHFGKTGHFRKEGIPMPQSVYKEDLHRFMSALQFYQPKRVVIVGDMFHSRMNKELDWFKRWRESFADVDFHLVMGNHDILHADWYREAGVNTSAGEYLNNEFSFVHDISGVEPSTEHYYFSGHVHPGVRISGAGRQSLQFPCFYFSPSYCILPAFSRFTGMATIRPGENDNVFAIVNRSIIAC